MIKSCLVPQQLLVALAKQYVHVCRAIKSLTLVDLAIDSGATIVVILGTNFADNRIIVVHRSLGLENGLLDQAFLADDTDWSFQLNNFT